MFKTVSGKRVLKVWRDQYVDNAVVSPGVDTNPYTSFYAMGQKELIMFFISLLRNEAELDDINIPQDY